VISPFGPRAQLAGSSDPRVERVPSADRFRTGGVNSIRGYTENQIPAPPANGGLALVLGNVELRVPLARLPLLGNLGLEAFVDFGNVWARPEYIRMAQFRPSVSRRPYGDRDVHYVFGLGPRLELPIGPLRVDLSWSARPSAVRGYLEPRVQFAIGPSI
jgi:outer membrane protein assembly factor BamA